MSDTLTLDPLRNNKDPLRKSGPDQQLELFRKFAAVAHGFGVDDVLGAAINMLVNGTRQAHADRSHAEAAFNERVGKAKQMLLDHYDSVTGKRRNIFPFTQHIHAAHFTDKDK